MLIYISAKFIVKTDNKLCKGVYKHISRKKFFGASSTSISKVDVSLAPDAGLNTRVTSGDRHYAWLAPTPKMASLGVVGSMGGIK